MTLLLPFLALAALAFKGKTKAAPNAADTEAKRIADLKASITQESLDIVNGKRDGYSDDTEAMDVAIRQAVEAADAQARLEPIGKNTTTPAWLNDPPAPAPKPAPAPAPRPVQELPPIVVTPRPAPYVAPPAPAPKPIAPRPTPNPAPIAPAPVTFPAGYDPIGARRVAPALARHLKNKGRVNYDRRLLEDFQRKAGITPDRIYGGQSAGALKYYGGTDAPPPFFPPLQVVAYVPPEQRK